MRDVERDGVGAALQQELDELAAAAGCSVSLDSPDGTLLGYSAQATDVDPVRVAAILARKVPDEVLAYQHSQGIASAQSAVRIAANPALHMSARTCLPIRLEQQVAAYLWVLDDAAHPLDASALQLVEAAGERIARLMPIADSAAIGTQLAALLVGEPRPDLMSRLAELEQGARGPLQFSCVIPTRVSGGDRMPATGASPDPDDADLVLGRASVAGRTLFLSAERGEGRPAADRSSVLGASAGFRISDVDSQGLARLAARAIVCAGCAAVDAALPLRTTWDDFGLYRQLLLSTRPDSWSSAEPFGEDSPAAAMLSHTLETYLDHGGDAARTIDTLGIHRTTFYYRLERVRSRYGIDLTDGLTRSELHVRLKLRRLAQARQECGWTAALLGHLA